MRSPRASSPSSRPASPRRASAGGAAFGSSSPRQLELWVGRFHETLQGGGTFNERASRAPGTFSDRPSSPGPGDYEASPSATNPNRNRNRNRNPHPHPHPNPNPNPNPNQVCKDVTTRARLSDDTLGAGAAGEAGDGGP